MQSWYFVWDVGDNMGFAAGTKGGRGGRGYHLEPTQVTTITHCKFVGTGVARVLCVGY